MRALALGIDGGCGTRMIIGSQLRSSPVTNLRYRPSSTTIRMEKFVPSGQKRFGRASTGLPKMKTGWQQNGKLAVDLSRIYEH